MSPAPADTSHTVTSMSAISGLGSSFGEVLQTPMWTVGVEGRPHGEFPDPDDLVDEFLDG